MAKIKKIPASTFKAIVKDVSEPSEVFEWNGIEVTVKKNLSFQEMFEFVDTVVKSCFTSDTNAFIPEAMECVTKMCVLEKYANFSLPDDISTNYKFIYNTDIVEAVLAHINIEQFNEICRAVKKKVEYIAKSNIEAFIKQLNEIYSSFDNIQTQIADAFNGVDEGGIAKLIDAISKGKLDEKKLVEAYITQSKHTDDSPIPDSKEEE